MSQDSKQILFREKMAKYLVETYYTCSFKVSHYLDEISEAELSDLNKRDDGKFEILDVKLDNRKTRNLNAKTSAENTMDKSIDKITENSKAKIFPNYENFEFY